MKRICKQALGFTICALTICARGQGTFKNLDFESPIGTLSGVGSPLTVPFTDAMPGWVGFVGSIQSDSVRIDGVNLDTATLALIRSNVFTGPSFAPLIEGNYSTVLQAQRDPSDINQLVQVSLAQSGLVPAGSLSLRFLAYTVGTPFSVALGAVNIPIVDLETFPNYHLYGGDISAFAGSTAELRFTAFPNNYPGSTVFALDSIQFSNQPIPEPGVFGLFALGSLLFGWRCHKMRNP